MKVAFISSGTHGLSPVIKAQGDSLQNNGIDIVFFTINKPGLWGYLSHVPLIAHKIRSYNPDLVHAHYSLCGIVAALATAKPKICSLMGSDVKSSGFWRLIIRFFVKHVWVATIVKSEDMKQSLGLASVAVIPNGVDVELFKPLDKVSCREQLGWPQAKKYILFAADPTRKEKNFELARKAVNLLSANDVELKVVHGVPHSELPIYMNASDLLLLSSLWEGSPNVVKEAMACNLCVVSTKVGDVPWLFSGTPGYHIVDADPLDIAQAIARVFKSSDLTMGRERLMRLDLDSIAVAKRINSVYCSIVHGKK